MVIKKYAGMAVGAWNSSLPKNYWDNSATKLYWEISKTKRFCNSALEKVNSLGPLQKGVVAGLFIVPGGGIPSGLAAMTFYAYNNPRETVNTARGIVRSVSFLNLRDGRHDDASLDDLTEVA